MASVINKKSLEALSVLARLELQDREAEKILTDLKSILEHFEELQNLNTENITSEVIPEESRKIFREDEERENTNVGQGKEAFPEKENGFLSIPPVF